MNNGSDRIQEMFCFRIIGAHSLRISSGGFKHLKVLFHPKNSSCL